MSAVLELENEVENNEAVNAPNFAEQLRAETAACRLRRTAFGTKKKIDHAHLAEAAEEWNASVGFVAAQKRLVNPGRPEYRKVTSALNESLRLWKESTVPYPEAGIRLIRKNAIDGFRAKIDGLKAELAEAVNGLQLAWDEVRNEAKGNLGELFNEADYPETIKGLWSIDVEFPSIEPPEYLKKLNPELFSAECDRLRARLNESVHLAEQAFAEEFQAMLKHLAERLQTGEDGKAKVFRDTAVENLKDFFQRFQALNVGSNSELDLLIAQAEGLVEGVVPGDLRKNVTLKDQVRDSIKIISDKLDGLIVAKPKRSIVLNDD